MARIGIAKCLASLVVVAALGVVITIWLGRVEHSIPSGIAFGNGRIEATEIDIATKLPGRVAEVRVDEGDMIIAGEVLARMDTKSLEAEIRKAKAEVLGAGHQKAHADALVRERDSECALREKELDRSIRLREKGHVSEERVDRDRTAVEVAKAACVAARAVLGGAEATLEAAIAYTERLNADIEDSILTSPRSGQVLFRLSEPGEVLPAGGRVLTVIDLDDVYMNVFLPAIEAGKAVIGADARILLDAFPEQPVTAQVSLVSPKAQFTPKEVETADERQKMMYRTKLSLVDRRDVPIKPGMTGIGYIRLHDTITWPEWLR